MDKTQRDYMMIAIQCHLECYLESKTGGNRERAKEEAKELAEGLSLSLRTAEAIIEAEKKLGIPDTIDVGDEEHMDIRQIPLE